MNPRRLTGLTAMLVGALLLAGTPVLGQDQGNTDAQLLDAIKSLQAEVSSLKAEVAKVRGSQTKILRELAMIKATSKAPPKRKPPKADTTIYDIKIGNSPVKGAKDAKVTIVEFVDLQCPFCAREYPKLQQMLKDYPNDVKVVFMNFPLSFHKDAKPAHAACMLAAKKSHETFWQMHDKIMAAPKKLAVDQLRGYAESLGLDLAEFDKVMADPAQQDALLAADMTEARKCKVRGTPSVYINGLKLADRKLTGYKARIDAILKGGDKKAGDLIKLDNPPAGIQLKRVGDK